MNFSYEEIKTIKDLIEDWGCDYDLTADEDKVYALRERLETYE